LSEKQAVPGGCSTTTALEHPSGVRADEGLSRVTRRQVQASVGTAAGAAALLAVVAEPAASASLRGSETGACATGEQAGEGEVVRARELVVLVNAHRRALGLRTVRPAAALERSAVWKARQMARNGYLSHDDLPGHRTLAQRLRQCGFAGGGWGEVLAAGQRRPRAVVRTWLSSPSHRAVIEARWWRAVGAGVARSPDGDRYWALDFGA
jgi:uncharacterized protein YkwD